MSGRETLEGSSSEHLPWLKKKKNTPKALEVGGSSTAFVTTGHCFLSFRLGTLIFRLSDCHESSEAPSFASLLHFSVARDKRKKQ